MVSSSVPVRSCLVRVRFTRFLRFGGGDWIAICLANAGRAQWWAGERRARCWDGGEAGREGADWDWGGLSMGGGF